jgi:hypothetical protein
MLKMLRLEANGARLEQEVEGGEIKIRGLAAEAEEMKIALAVSAQAHAAAVAEAKSAVQLIGLKEEARAAAAAEAVRLASALAKEMAETKRLDAENVSLGKDVQSLAKQRDQMQSELATSLDEQVRLRSVIGASSTNNSMATPKNRETATQF